MNEHTEPISLAAWTDPTTRMLIEGFRSEDARVPVTVFEGAAAEVLHALLDESVDVALLPSPLLSRNTMCVAANVTSPG